MVTGTPQLTAYPPSHPTNKGMSASHQVFCFYLKPHKKNKISQFPCTISTINKTRRLHTWLQVQTGQCRQPGPAPPSPAPNKTPVEKTQIHLQTEICTWQGKNSTQNYVHRQLGRSSHPTPPPDMQQKHDGPRDGHWTETEGKPEWKTGGTAAVEARHGLETHMNYK